MGRGNDQQIERGATAYGPDNPIASTDTVFLAIRGSEKEFEDRSYADVLGATTVNSARRCKMRLLRNMVAGNILPRQVVNIDPNGKDVASVATVPGLALGVVDPSLPAAGCRQYDLCWIAVEGPTETLTPDADATANITAGGVLEPTAAGRVIIQPAFTAGTDAATTLVLFTRFNGFVGTADAAVAKTAHATAVPTTLHQHP